MKRIYLLRLNDSRSGVGPVRFAAYVASDAGLSVLWPHPDSPRDVNATATQHKRRSKAEAAKLGMVYSAPRSNDIPAFHYSRKGCGYSKEQDIAEDISRLVYPGEVCEVHTITGWAPSLVGRFIDGKYAERSEGGAA